MNNYNVPMSMTTGAPTSIKEYFMSVNNESVVQSYPIAPGNAIWFIDATHNVVYRKQCDYNGALALNAYDMTLRPQQTAVGGDGDLRNELETIKQQLASILPVIEELKS